MSDRELLLVVLAEVRALRREVAEQRAEREPRALRAEDQSALLLLLPALRDAFGPAKFGAWEMLDRAAALTAEGANLRAALGGRNAHALGKLLARGAGVSVGGLRILRDGRGPDGALWRCIVNPSS